MSDKTYRLPAAGEWRTFVPTTEIIESKDGVAQPGKEVVFTTDDDGFFTPTTDDQRAAVHAMNLEPVEKPKARSSATTKGDE